VDGPLYQTKILVARLEKAACGARKGHQRLPDVVSARGDLCAWEIILFGTRYGGSYEGGDNINWIAWIGEPEWLDDYRAGDVACAGFFADYMGAPMGRGPSPDTALDDLVRQAPVRSALAKRAKGRTRL
jgi:hypothetical protein